jgi:hypothetical protein
MPRNRVGLCQHLDVQLQMPLMRMALPEGALRCHHHGATGGYHAMTGTAFAYAWPAINCQLSFDRETNSQKATSDRISRSWRTLLILLEIWSDVFWPTPRRYIT